MSRKANESSVETILTKDKRLSAHSLIASHRVVSGLTSRLEPTDVSAEQSERGVSAQV